MYEVVESEKTWPDTDEERVAYADWQYAVVSGDTLRGFRAYIEYEWNDLQNGEPPGECWLERHENTK